MADDQAVKSSAIVSQSRDVARERWTLLKEEVDNARYAPNLDEDEDVGAHGRSHTPTHHRDFCW
jgi:hypothetical protein